MVNGRWPGRSMKPLSVMPTHTDAGSLPGTGHTLSVNSGQSLRSRESSAMILLPKNGFMSMTTLISATPTNSWMSLSNTCPTACRDRMREEVASQEGEAEPVGDRMEERKGEGGIASREGNLNDMMDVPTTHAGTSTGATHAMGSSQ